MHLSIFFSFSCLLCSLISFGQSSPDGRSFLINYYVNKNFESDDTLYFENGMLNFSSATLFGFQPAEYKAKTKDTTIVVYATNKSKVNGSMFWSLTISKENVEGTCTYDRLNENPVKYTIKGKELKRSDEE